MSEAVEWARLAWDITMGLLSLALTVLVILLLLNFMRTFWNFYSEGRHELPSTRVLLRRIWCRHRTVARVRTRYGFRQTRCASCGTDVNRNRPTELRR